MILDELVAILGLDYRGEGEARKMKADLRSIEQAVTGLGTRMVDALRPAVAIGATVAAGLATAMGKGVIAASAEWEKYTATLETIEGSSEKAKASLDWVSAFAKKTPYDLSQVTEAFIRMKAYGLDPTDGSLEALGDAGSAMGKDLMSAVEAMADAANFEFERLKEFGLTTEQAGNKVTFSWNKNGKAFRETVDKNGEAITRFIKLHMQEQFGGAMVRQSKTFDGLMSNLGESWQDFMRRIGQGGFFDTVKNRVADMLDAVSGFDADGTLDRWSQNLSSGFTRAADGIEVVVRQIARHFTFISDNWAKVEPYLKAIGAAFLLLGVRLFPITAALAGLAFVLDEIFTYLENGDGLIQGFIDDIAAFLGADPEKVASVLEAIALAAGGLATAAIGVSLFAGAITSLGRALMVLTGAKAALGLLSRLAGISWGSAAAGAAGAATAAGAAVGAGTAAAGAAAAPAAGGALSGAARVLGLAGAAAGPAVFGGSRVVPWTDAQLQMFEEGAAERRRKAQNTEPMEIDLNKLKLGMQRHYGVSPEALQGLADRIGGMMGKVLGAVEAMRPSQGGTPLGNFGMMAKLALDTAEFMGPANAAKAVMTDLQAGATARIDADIGPFMEKIGQARRAMDGLRFPGGSHAGVGKSVLEDRVAVIASPAAP